ncbi:transporter substrate-binding domain-containing protein [Kingella negevensis]|uniref:Putative ABC transporter arginine-binding protein 2 n=1 Tax=Kingella negevensis TaxID=1522312 RepID=A0A238HIG3_9NEIS|nr:transporter substrate-binding domain-containing protein [Kingella negevensis]SNB78192.1 Putative ABC transporter arginine-binding protein 2 precursor [Kingella negevensis]
MKKTALFVSCLLALTACGDNTQSSNNAAPAADKPAASAPAATASTPTANAETLIIGTDATFPPFDFKDNNGQIVGFDIDILTAIAKQQGLSVTFISAPRSDLFTNLNADAYHILAACLGINPDRLSKSEMSDPYIFSPNVIMGKEDGAKAQVLTDLVGKKVAIQAGSYSTEALKKAQVTDVKEEKTAFAAYSDLLRGNVDYIVGDAGVLSYHHAENKEAGKPKLYTSIYDKTEDARVGFAVKKGNVELQKKLNNGLKAIKEDGTYDKIYAKWFGDNDSLRVKQ